MIMNVFLSFAKLLRPVFGEVAPGSGHAISSESLQFPGSQDTTEHEEGLSYYTEMGKDPIIAAMSIMPSMAILTTPERSLNNPAYAPRAMGVAVANDNWRIPAITEKSISITLPILVTMGLLP